jgi:hypothetical protein
VHYPLRPPPHRPPPSRRRSFPPHRRRFRFRPPRMRRRGTSCYYFHPLPSPPATTHDVRRRSPAPPRHRRRRIGESRGSGCGDVAFFMWRGKICVYVFMYMLYTTGGGGLYIRYLYMSKKHIIGLNRVKKTYFYVKMTYVFMFLCFGECSSR